LVQKCIFFLHPLWAQFFGHFGSPILGPKTKYFCSGEFIFIKMNQSGVRSNPYSLCDEREIDGLHAFSRRFETKNIQNYSRKQQQSSINEV